MAKVPLAGTNYIPGVTEESTLAEIKDMMQKYLADSGQALEGARDDDRTQHLSHEDRDRRRGAGRAARSRTSTTSRCSTTST